MSMFWGSFIGSIVGWLAVAALCLKIGGGKNGK